MSVSSVMAEGRNKGSDTMEVFARSSLMVVMGEAPREDLAEETVRDLLLRATTAEEGGGLQVAG